MADCWYRLVWIKERLLIVDHFARYPEVIKLHLPHQLVSSKLFMQYCVGMAFQKQYEWSQLQYASQEFTKFGKLYGFNQTTSSARYLQSNGQAEHTVKQFLRWSKDPHMALLSYRTTPMSWSSLSPAVGRRRFLFPKWTDDSKMVIFRKSRVRSPT